MIKSNYDKIIIGAGIYGLYSALLCGKKGEKVLVLEYDESPFMRATYINQARVHMGYHYPRSFTTAIKSAGYYEKFLDDFSFSIKNDFQKIYAISKNFSWTNAKQFKKFCDDANILCEEVSNDLYFKNNVVEGTFKTKECTYDAKMISRFYLDEIDKYENVDIKFNARIEKISQNESTYEISLNSDELISAPFVLNASYASINQILNKLNLEMIDIKYELCEIILCEVDKEFKETGITIMDGPFFSLMPFGQTGYHSLTSVSQTPHKTSHDNLPTFDCQSKSNNTCSPNQLGNCNTCVARPKSSWEYMKGLANKYLKDSIKIEYRKSLFSVKPILKTSEIDDSRPTVIKIHSENPTFVSVLSGKINTIYDLNELLKYDSK